MGNGPHSSKLVVICVVPLLICVVLFLFVLFYVLFVCKCVLYYCHRVLTEFFLLSYKANARIKLPKMGNGPHSSKLVVICVVLLLFVLLYVLFVCKCVLYHCHRLSIQLHLTNISAPVQIISLVRATHLSISFISMVPCIVTLY